MVFGLHGKPSLHFFNDALLCTLALKATTRRPLKAIYYSWPDVKTIFAGL